MRALLSGVYAGVLVQQKWFDSPPKSRGFGLGLVFPFLLG